MSTSPGLSPIKVDSGSQSSSSKSMTPPLEDKRSREFFLEIIIC